MKQIKEILPVIVIYMVVMVGMLLYIKPW